MTLLMKTLWYKMKIAKQFLKTYEEIFESHFKNCGIYYPPRTWEEFYDWKNKNYEKYIKGKEGISKTKSYISFLDIPRGFGFYIAFQKLDYKFLNNVIYQTSRQKLLIGGMLASGTDHCNMLERVLSALSCNDFEAIDSFLPKGLHPARNIFSTEVSVNLINVLYYKESEFKKEALEIADKFLSKKITTWNRYIVLYFKALIEEDAEEASRCLQELCVAYQKVGHSVDSIYNKLHKYFATEIHGLYRFAKIVNQDLFYNIKQPKHFCFSEEFELWQKENDYPKGEVFYKYPQEMDYMNKIFQAELPTVALYEPDQNKKLYKNVDKFLIDLTENANRL